MRRLRHGWTLVTATALCACGDPGSDVRVVRANGATLHVSHSGAGERESRMRDIGYLVSSPDAASVYAGDDDYVFVALGGGGAAIGTAMFRPRDVRRWTAAARALLAPASGGVDVADETETLRGGEDAAVALARVRSPQAADTTTTYRLTVDAQGVAFAVPALPAVQARAFLDLLDAYFPAVVTGSVTTARRAATRRQGTGARR